MKDNNNHLAGTKTQLLGAIGSPLNWQGDNSAVYQLGSSTLFNFAVTGPASIATINATSVSASSAAMGGNIIKEGNGSCN